MSKVWIRSTSGLTFDGGIAGQKVDSVIAEKDWLGKYCGSPSVPLLRYSYGSFLGLRCARRLRARP
jgi:hypothetical protein